jgi:multidrug efflux system membrane fusion protein
MNLQSPAPLENQPAPEEGWAAMLPARRYLIGGAALALVLGGYWYWSHGDNGPVRRREAAVPVRVGVATKRDMPVVEHTIGTVLPNTSVSVTARVTGQLMAVYFKEGNLVKIGQKLFQIDPRPYQATFDQARAQMAHDQASLTGAELDEKRYTALYAQNAISTQQRDDAVATAAADRALVASDNATVETARLNLEYTNIVSPVNGKTGAILVQPGNMVTASASVGASALVTINEIQPVKVSMALPQSDLPRIQAMAQKQNLKAKINQHDQGGGTLLAPINFIGNAVNNTSGTIELRASFANADSALVPGQLVDVTVALDNIPDAIVVPREAINTGPSGQFVYVVNEDLMAEERDIKVLFDDGTNDAIEGPVRDGETIIVDGQLRVVPGAKVSIAPTPGRGGARGRAAGRRGGRRGQAAAD